MKLCVFYRPTRWSRHRTVSGRFIKHLFQIRFFFYLCFPLLAAHSSVPGGLFHPDDDHQEIAFRYAVEKINSDRTILPRSKLLAQIERISPQDSFLASKRGKRFFRLSGDATAKELSEPQITVFFYFALTVCHLLGVGVAAIFGPQSSHTASHVQSICDTMEVS